MTAVSPPWPPIFSQPPPHPAPPQLQPFGLTKSEVVQLINHRPPSVVEIFLVSVCVRGGSRAVGGGLGWWWWWGGEPARGGQQAARPHLLCSARSYPSFCAARRRGWGSVD